MSLRSTSAGFLSLMVLTLTLALPALAAPSESAMNKARECLSKAGLPSLGTMATLNKEQQRAADACAHISGIDHLYTDLPKPPPPIEQPAAPTVSASAPASASGPPPAAAPPPTPSPPSAPSNYRPPKRAMSNESYQPPKEKDNTGRNNDSSIKSFFGGK